MRSFDSTTSSDMVNPNMPRDSGAPRKILFLTGTRADFGKLKPLIHEVSAAPELEYEIFVTGMHMLSRYGATVREIRQAGFEQLYCFINQDSSINSQMDLVLATTVQGIGHYLRESRPDLLVVHGDRVEALAGAIAGSFNNVLVAHIEGGELSGTIDELVRHAVSKLSHLHFVANAEARQRLVQMGETEESIFVVGSPDVDVMLSGRLPDIDEVRIRYEIPFDDYFILLYHPVTTELGRTADHARNVVDAALESGHEFRGDLPEQRRGIRPHHARAATGPWELALPAAAIDEVRVFSGAPATRPGDRRQLECGHPGGACLRHSHDQHRLQTEEPLHRPLDPRCAGGAGIHSDRVAKPAAQSARPAFISATDAAPRSSSKHCVGSGSGRHRHRSSSETCRHRLRPD
jgi:hypothetical protein